MSTPVRLGDLLHDGKLLWGWCAECCLEKDIDPASLPLPPDTPVLEITKYMRCSRYGSKKVDVRPELYPGGITAMREKWGSTQ